MENPGSKESGGRLLSVEVEAGWEGGGSTQ
jgi:hypothetical protein